MMKKKRLAVFVGILLLYCLLLMVLVAAESTSPDAGITTFPQAIWYSLVTMTTVGYGDLYPVTAVGRIIGVLFLLCSAGALTALISLSVSWLTGKGLPKMMLRHLRGKAVYIFAQDDAASRALAADIEKTQPQAMPVFADELGVADILRCLAPHTAPTVIFTGEDAEVRMAECREWGNARLVHMDAMDLRSQGYWSKYPLALTHQCVVLMGFGRLGRLLLEHGLQGNILTPVRSIEYHVFGDGSDFLRDHHQLSESLSLGESSEERDSLIFHEDAWNASRDLLLRADRIILCGDDDKENLERYRRLRTYFPVSAEVHVYCSSVIAENVPAFGTDKEIYTVENLFRPKLEVMARRMHEIYRESSGGNAPSWEELSDFLQRSNLASAEHARDKERYLAEHPDAPKELLRKIEHERWCRFHVMYNWVYDPVRDNGARKHPMLRPYEELSEADRAKNDYAWELIRELEIE